MVVSASSLQSAPKSKFVKIYEDFFKGLDPSDGRPNFWNTLFLIRVDVAYLESELAALSTDQLYILKDTINSIFYHCVEALSENHPIRIINSMQTLSVLIREITRKFKGSNSAYEQINILIGYDSSEMVVPKFIKSLDKIISESDSMTLKKRAVRLALVVATAKDNVNQNALLDYFMRFSIFESICHVFACGPDRTDVGTDAVILLLILINYRKYEVSNPYAVKLSILDNELALNGLGQIIAKVLQEFNSSYAMKQLDPTNYGIFSSITNTMSRMLVGEEKTLNEYRVNDALLFALYEGVHLNRNFISVLTRNHSDDIMINESSSFASQLQNTDTATKDAVSCDLSPVDVNFGTGVEQRAGDFQMTAQTLSGGTVAPGSAGAMGSGMSLGATGITASEPSNILVSFFQYMSYIMNDTKDPAKFANAKLCLIIVTCIVEDQYANYFLHDNSITFRVNLYQPPTRHKKPGTEKSRKPVCLVVSLLELLCNFLSTHLKKVLPYELHAQSLAVIYRIICHQKKNKIRLVGYNWQVLWEALISFIKFIVNNNGSLSKLCDCFSLAAQALGILNLFITFGDAFLPNPSSYDELYYEIVRMFNVFDDLYSVALQHVRNNGPFQESAARVLHSLTNIRSIISHFNPKIKCYQEVNNVSALSVEQVLEIVRTNYDTLALRMQDSLDQYERYNEKPTQHFFSNLMKTILHECRLGLPITSVEQKELLDEFATLNYE